MLWCSHKQTSVLPQKGCDECYLRPSKALIAKACKLCSEISRKYLLLTSERSQATLLLHSRNRTLRILQSCLCVCVTCPCYSLKRHPAFTHSWLYLLRSKSQFWLTLHCKNGTTFEHIHFSPSRNDNVVIDCSCSVLVPVPFLMRM